MIELVNIKKSFGPKTITNELSLTVNEGEFLVIVGRSGEGKSVLLKQIIGLLTPDSGEVFLEGKEISRLQGPSREEVYKKCGYVFQFAALLDSLTVFENIGITLLEKGEHPDHVVVIKHVPFVGDSKRAMDEYTSNIFLNGQNTIVMHNTCEDSLLAAPLILDLFVLTEVAQRITLREKGDGEFQTMHPVLSLLSYLTKAPIVPPGTPVVNALFKQRDCMVNLFRACVGLQSYVVGAQAAGVVSPGNSDVFRTSSVSYAVYSGA